MYNGKRIVVSMTSWTKRIGNVATVVSSLLNQALMPDSIEINLSLDEFPNKENDLPAELISLLNTNSSVVINWVNGNDGVFKKIIPVLKKYYGEDYYLLSVDDDYIYRDDYIDKMVKWLIGFGGDTFCLSNYLVIGNRMIYKSVLFKPEFWEKLTPEIISCRIDDAYIARYLVQKKINMRCYRPADTPDIMKVFNPVSPNSHNDVTGSYSKEDVDRADMYIAMVSFDE